MYNSFKITAFFLSILFFISSTGHSQTNLLQDSLGLAGTKYWKYSGEAALELTGSGKSVFAVRNKGSIWQEFVLPKDSAGKYVLLISRCSSERVEPNGIITGLPYLYGYMLNRGQQTRGSIDEYLQGQNMRCRPTTENEWVYQWGVFKVPPTTVKIRLYLDQAERSGVPQNGSIARFDDVGAFLFESESEAFRFITDYSAKYN